MPGIMQRVRARLHERIERLGTIFRPPVVSLYAHPHAANGFDRFMREYEARNRRETSAVKR